MQKKMELDRALEVFEYNKAMLTCDMSIGRNPEHQDVSPDYYGKDAENLYYAIVCVEKYIKKAIPKEWLKRYELAKGQEVRLQDAINEWEKENGE